MTKELIERLRRIAVLEAESAGFSKEDAAEWEAADAIESLQVENERLIADNKSFDAANTEMIGDVNTLIKERDALAAKLAALSNKEPWMVAAIDAAKGGQQ